MTEYNGFTVVRLLAEWMMSTHEDGDSVGTGAGSGRSPGDGDHRQFDDNPSNVPGQRSGKRIRMTDYDEISSDEEERVRRGRKRRMPSDYAYDSRSDYDMDYDRRGSGYPPYYQGPGYGPPSQNWYGGYGPSYGGGFHMSGPPPNMPPPPPSQQYTMNRLPGPPATGVQSSVLQDLSQGNPGLQDMINKAIDQYFSNMVVMDNTQTVLPPTPTPTPPPTATVTSGTVDSMSSVPVTSLPPATVTSDTVDSAPSAVTLVTESAGSSVKNQESKLESSSTTVSSDSTAVVENMETSVGVTEGGLVDYEQSEEEDGYVYTDGLDSECDSDNDEDRLAKDYKEKIKRIRIMSNLSEPSTQEGEKKSTARSLDIEGTRVRYLLPASSDFIMDRFDNYLKLVKGESSKKKVNPMDRASFPALYSPRMANYQVEDCPWKVSFLESDGSLYKSKIYPSENNPPFKCKAKQILDLETNNREALSVGSYTDTFLWAGKRKLQNISKKLNAQLKNEEEPVLEKEQMENLHKDAKEALGYLGSAAKGLNDIIKMTVDRVCTLGLMRRDSWFQAFDQSLGRPERLKLRQAELNGNFLFGEDMVQEAIKSVKEDMSDRVKEVILKSAAEKKSSGGFKGSGNNFRSQEQSSSQNKSKNKGKGLWYKGYGG